VFFSKNTQINRHIKINLTLVASNNLKVFENLRIQNHDIIEVDIKGSKKTINAIIFKDEGLNENMLHVNAAWKNQRIICRDISEEIAKLLKLDLLLVDDLIWSSPLDFLDVLEGEGTEINAEVRKYYEDIKLKESSIKTATKNTGIQKDISEFNGIKAEKKVFKNLIKLYRDKNFGCSPITESTYVFETTNIKIEWVRGTNSKSDHDIVIQRKYKGKVRNTFIEVKSSVNPHFDRNGESLYYSDKEWNKIFDTHKNGEDYFLAVVFNNSLSYLDEKDLNIVKIVPHDVEKLIVLEKLDEKKIELQNVN